MIYVLSGTYAEAVMFAHSKGFQRSRVVSVDSEERITGIRGKKLFVVGTAYRRRDIGGILNRASVKEFTVEHV